MLCILYLCFMIWWFLCCFFYNNYCFVCGGGRFWVILVFIYVCWVVCFVCFGYYWVISVFFYNWCKRFCNGGFFMFVWCREKFWCYYWDFDIWWNDVIWKYGIVVWCYDVRDVVGDVFGLVDRNFVILDKNRVWIDFVEYGLCVWIFEKFGNILFNFVFWVDFCGKFKVVFVSDVIIGMSVFELLVIEGDMDVGFWFDCGMWFFEIYIGEWNEFYGKWIKWWFLYFDLIFDLSGLDFDY